MILIKPIIVAGAPASTSPVSQAVSAGGMVFIGGQMPRDPVSGLIPPDRREQVRLTMAHCLEILQSAGCARSDVAMVFAYVTDLAVKSALNEEFVRVFGDHRPTRNLVQVSAIGEDAVVELSMIAVAGSPERAA